MVLLTLSLALFLSALQFQNTLAMENEKQNIGQINSINKVGTKDIGERLLINESERKNEQLKKFDRIGYVATKEQESMSLSIREDFTKSSEIDYVRKDSEDTSKSTDTTLSSPMKQEEEMVSTNGYTSEKSFAENTEKKKCRKFSFDYKSFSNSVKAKFANKGDGCGICFENYDKSIFKSNQKKKKLVLPCCSYHVCCECRENCVKRDNAEGWVFVLNYGLALNEIVKCFKCPNCRKIIPQDEKNYKMLAEMQNENICIKLHEQIVIWQKAEVDSLLALMVQAKLNNGYYTIIKDYISQHDETLFQMINDLEPFLPNCD
jgi:hypothetical protein